MALRVFVSSTFSDLAEHRAAVKSVMEKSLTDMYQYVGPEYLSAGEQPSLEDCLNELKNSTFLILLIGWRYGYVPEGYEKIYR